MVNWVGLKIFNEQNSKIVTMDWGATKKLMLFFVLFIFLALFLFISLTITLKINGKIVTFNSFGEKVPTLSYIFIGFLFFIIIGFFFYYPLKIEIKNDKNGNFIINKRDWFFSNNEYNLKQDQSPVLIARKRRMVRTTMFVGKPVFQPIIRYNENGTVKEINLIFIASYFMKGMGPRRVIEKGQAQEISKFLRMTLVVEE